MITVSAKQFRQNLSAYLDRIEAGEEVSVIRNSKIVGSMAAPNKETPNGKAAAAAMRDFMEKNKYHKHSIDTSRPYKELYHEHLVEKYGKYTHQK